MDAAQTMDVGRTSVQAATQVIKKGVKILVEALDRGTLSIARAAEIAAASKDEQARLLEVELAPQTPTRSKPKSTPDAKSKLRKTAKSTPDVENKPGQVTPPIGTIDGSQVSTDVDDPEPTKPIPRQDEPTGNSPFKPESRDSYCRCGGDDRPDLFATGRHRNPLGAELQVTGIG